MTESGFIYLASPYSHTDPGVMEWRYRMALRAAATLMKRGNAVYSPIAHSHEIGKYLKMQAGGNINPRNHKFWIDQCLVLLRSAGSVAVLKLPGWEESLGVAEEIEFAKSNDIHVEYFDPADVDLDLSGEPAQPLEYAAAPPGTWRVPSGFTYAPLTWRTDAEAPGARSTAYVPTGDTKNTNPKDLIGTRKAPMSTVPANVLAEIGVAMLEGASKYGRHNYRAAGVRASVYYDATLRHLMSWWEGEDVDPDSGMSHIVKAITGLVVLRDAQTQGMCTDDRPPSSAPFLVELNERAAAIIDRYADKRPRHYTIEDSRDDAR